MSSSPALPSEHPQVHADSSCVVKRRHEDCLSCRLISGLGVVGIGAYLFTLAKRKPSGGPRTTLMVLSGVVATLGVSRLLNLQPTCNKWRTDRSHSNQPHDNKFWRRRFDEYNPSEDKRVPRE